MSFGLDRGRRWTDRHAVVEALAFGDLVVQPEAIALPSVESRIIDDVGVFPGFDAANWYVVRTRSRQEKALAADLDARSIRCFLPLTRTVRYYGRRKVRAMMPLFPGYLFMAGEREDCYIAERTGRVAQVLSVADQDALRLELSSIAQVLQSDGLLTPCEPLVRGALVEVSSGPFKGIRGRVDVRVRDNRLILHVDMVGNAAVLEIDRDLLIPVD